MSNGNGTAPVCPVSRSEWPAVSYPAQQVIVPAVDLPSAIAALQQINQIMQQLKALPPSNNIMIKPAPDPNPGPGGGHATRPAWEPEILNYIPVRIHNPNDDSVYVELKRLDHLRYRERKTQVKLEWRGNFGNTDY
jgi:hypothetical protein